MARGRLTVENAGRQNHSVKVIPNNCLPEIRTRSGSAACLIPAARARDRGAARARRPPEHAARPARPAGPAGPPMHARWCARWWPGGGGRWDQDEPSARLGSRQELTSGAVSGLHPHSPSFPPPPPMHMPIPEPETLASSLSSLSQAPFISLVSAQRSLPPRSLPRPTVQSGWAHCLPG